jgi:hypothetical protein
LGFAGSVYIGFQMVGVMRNWLRCDQPDHAWKPLEAVDLWPAIAREAGGPAEAQPQSLSGI